MARSGKRKNPSDRQRVNCWRKLAVLPGAPQFRVDSYGCVVSLYAGRGEIFHVNIDHIKPVALGGLTVDGNLAAVQWYINHLKSASLVDTEEERQQLVRLAGARAVTLPQFQALQAQLKAEAAGQPAIGVGRLAQLRSVPRWDPEQVEALLGWVAKRCLRIRKGPGRQRQEVTWQHIATAVSKAGPKRTYRECKDQLRRLLPSRAEEEAAQGQVPYRYFSAEENNTAVLVLEGLGKLRLAALIAGKPLPYASLPKQLDEASHRAIGAKAREAPCPQGSRDGMQKKKRPLEVHFPEHSRADVVDKCRRMVEAAIQLAFNNLDLHDRLGRPRFTPEQWARLGPHLPRLATDAQLARSMHAQAVGAAGQHRLWRFVLKPDVYDLPALAEYDADLVPWAESYLERHAAGAAAEQAAAAGAAAAGAAGASAGAADGGSDAPAAGCHLGQRRAKRQRGEAAEDDALREVPRTKRPYTRRTAEELAKIHEGVALFYGKVTNPWVAIQQWAAPKLDHLETDQIQWAGKRLRQR
ncbi:hypothetical protein ABPG75_004628 [Micractinium tetrahymenae]